MMTDASDNVGGGTGDWVRDVLHFWFDELDRKAWFTKLDATDDKIRARFLDLHNRVRSTSSAELLIDADTTALAAVIVLDQFHATCFEARPMRSQVTQKRWRSHVAPSRRGWMVGL